jgi:hypothetical protein
VILARHRIASSIPGDPFFSDLPLAKFATLEAESIILEQGMAAADKSPEPMAPAIESLRDHAIAGLAAGGGIVPEELLAGLRDIDEPEKEVDMGIALQMLPESRKTAAVTGKDVIAAFGNDALLSKHGKAFHVRGFALSAMGARL